MNFSKLWSFPNLSGQEKSASEILSRLCVFGSPASFIAACVHFSSGRTLLGLVLLATSFSLLFGYLILKSISSFWGRVSTFFLVLPLLGVEHIIYGKGSGFEMVFPLITAATLVVFTESEKKARLFGAVGSLVCIAVSELYLDLFPPLLTFSREEYLGLRVSMIFGLIFSFYLMFRYYILLSESRQKKLVESNELFELVNSSIDEAFWILRQKDFSFLYISPAIEKIWGLSIAELLKNPAVIMQNIHEDDRGQFEKEFGSKTSDHFDIHYKFKRKNTQKHDEWIFCHVKATKKNSFQGTDAVWVGVTIDETSKVKIENEAEEIRLQSVHASRLALLGEMAGGIAHEINNPLTVMAGLVAQVKRKAIQNTIEPATLLESADKLERMILRVATIVKGLRTFSADGIRENEKVFQIETVVTDTLALCQEKFKANGVSVLFTLPCPDLKVFGNEIQISQVLLNLLSNSFDAISKSDEPWVQVSVYQDRDEAVILVEDSGAGISTEIQEKMMNPFFTTKEVGKGTGLGLSISLGIMKRHKGTLLYKKGSKNTAFEIRLKCSEERLKDAS